MREVLARAGLARVRIVEHGIARAIAASGAGFSVVAFRGTRPGVLADLLADADVRLVRWAGAGRVHAGFAAALRPFASLRAERVWYAGHSLGGALATLAHALRPGAGLVTFGAPRAGDREFAAAFPGRAWRVVNNSDLVPRLPPPPYRHVGRLRHFDRRGDLLAAPPAAARLADRLRGHADRVADAFARLARGEPAGIPFDTLVDHSPLLYATHCWNACAASGVS